MSASIILLPVFHVTNGTVFSGWLNQPVLLVITFQVSHENTTETKRKQTAE